MSTYNNISRQWALASASGLNIGREWVTTIICTILISISASAQSITSREVTKLERFDRVVLANGINMNIIKGSKPKITIKGERTVVAQVVCQVKDGELNIYATKFKYKKSPRIEITLEIDSALTSIYGSSGNKVRCEVPFTCENLELTAKYGCDFFFNVNTDFIKVKAETGSDIRLVGNTHKADLYAETTSTIRAFKMTASITSIACRQQCEIDVYTSDALTVSSSSYCTIRYKGNPPSAQINVSKYSTAHSVGDDAI